MEKRYLGIILAVLGIVGLILATFGFINGGSGAQHARVIIRYYGVVGLILFTAEISLIRTTRDKLSYWVAL